MASYGHLYKPMRGQRNFTKGVFNSLGLRESTMKNITNLQKTLVKYMENNNNDIYRMRELYNWSISYRDKDNNPVNEDWQKLIEMGNFEMELGTPLGTRREWKREYLQPREIIDMRIKYLVWCIDKGYTIMAKYLINKLHSSKSYYSPETEILVKPLFAAIEKRNMELIKDMLDKGTNPNAKNIIEDPNAKNITADPNIEGYMEITPLMMASKTQNVEVVNYLLEKGADPKIKDDRGLSSIDIAKATKNREIIRLLNRVVKPLSNVTEDIKDDLRYRSNAIPIKVNEDNAVVEHKGEKYNLIRTNESAKKVLGNKDLSELISEYGGKRRKCATKKTRRKKSMYKRKSKKRLSKSN